jgi:hypothetical protein
MSVAHTSSGRAPRFTSAGDGILGFGDVLDEPVVKAMLGCVIGAIGGALLWFVWGAALAPWIEIPLLVAVIGGCLIAGMGSLIGLGNVVPRR